MTVVVQTVLETTQKNLSLNIKIMVKKKVHYQQIHPRAAKENLAIHLASNVI